MKLAPQRARRRMQERPGKVELAVLYETTHKLSHVLCVCVTYASQEALAIGCTKSLTYWFPHG